MNTINNFSFVNFGASIPLSKYKGPVLKLTAKDKKQILLLEKQITDKEADAYKLTNILSKKMYQNERDYYSYKLSVVEFDIEVLREAIRSIKINRFNKQKAKQSKKLDTNI